MTSRGIQLRQSRRFRPYRPRSYSHSPGSRGRPDSPEVRAALANPNPPLTDHEIALPAAHVARLLELYPHYAMVLPGSRELTENMIDTLRCIQVRILVEQADGRRIPLGEALAARFD
jgi:hypothetical protein